MQPQYNITRCAVKCNTMGCARQDLWPLDEWDSGNGLLHIGCSIFCVNFRTQGTYADSDFKCPNHNTQEVERNSEKSRETKRNQETRKMNQEKPRHAKTSQANPREAKRSQRKQGEQRNHSEKQTSTVGHKNLFIEVKWQSGMMWMLCVVWNNIWSVLVKAKQDLRMS